MEGPVDLDGDQSLESSCLYSKPNARGCCKGARESSAPAARARRAYGAAEEGGIGAARVGGGESTGGRKGKEEGLEQLGYVETLEQGGFVSSWRKDAMDWICKVHSYYNFGPLSLCLSVNYLDRFLSTFNLPHDNSWVQQLMTVACLSLAVKMEETVAPLPVDLQVCDAKYFDARNIKRMELLVMETLQWRMHAVTPFSFMCYFLDKFNEGKPPSYMLASRCAELIVGTVKDYRFLSFRPSEIAAAVVLSALAENQFIDFGTALAASEIPVNKEMIVRCYELLVKKRGNLSASLSAPQSPIAVLDAACFSFRSDDTTPGSSPSNNNSGINNDQASTPASKKRRLSTSPI